MYTINLNEQKGVKLLMFPDNQPHIKLEVDPAAMVDQDVHVICSITSASRLVQLVETADALDHLYAKKKLLLIPYLMGARFDRIMEEGDSFDLKVIAKMINSTKFERVVLYDVHSDVSTALIENSISMSNANLLRRYDKKNAILISPDAGSAKKSFKYMMDNTNLTEVVQCVKHRNLSDGMIELTVLNPEKCKDRDCVIVDDLCDGGGTVMLIASQLPPTKSLTLIVTHGIFSKGTKLFEKYFTEVIVSDSYPFNSEHLSKIVTVVKHPY